MKPLVPLSRPDISELEKSYVAEALNSFSLSRGPMLRAFEQAFATRLGRTAIGVNSGTAALHLALRLSHIGAGDEVIVPPFTVAATINTVWQTGATPVFADIDANSMALSATAVERALSERTKAVIPVHPYGLLADIEQIRSKLGQRPILIIEDACEALGSMTAIGPAGALGDFAAFGFYPNKQITTGEGGMLVCAPESAERAHLLRNHGRSMDGSWLDQLEPGYNYRLPELSAALGRAQLERLDEFVAARQAVACRYTRQLQALQPDITLPTPPPHQTQVSWFAYIIRVEGGRARRDQIARLLDAERIQCGRYFAPLNRQPAWRNRSAASALPVADRVADSVLALPFFNRLDAPTIDRVCEALARALDRTS